MFRIDLIVRSRATDDGGEILVIEKGDDLIDQLCDAISDAKKQLSQINTFTVVRAEIVELTEKTVRLIVPSFVITHGEDEE